MAENAYQAKLIKTIHKLFPGCVVLKNDSSYKQGVPDLTVLYGERWGVLEVKAERGSRSQPNQNYYIELLDDMSFGAVIYPEIEKAVLAEMSRLFIKGRRTRLT